MKSLVLFSYRQPVSGSSFRWGVLDETRDTVKEPLSRATIFGPYRAGDKNFERTRNLDMVLTSAGPKAFYKERQRLRVRVPFIGSLVKRFLPAG